MKKKVLLSVFAASLFAAPVALAADNFQPVAPGPNHFDGASNGDNSADFKLTDVTQKEVDASLTAKQIKKVEAKNNVTVDKDGVLREKGPKAPKAPAKGQKALPKTSAVK